MKNSEELKTGEVADLLKVSPETVRRYVNRGLLDCHRLPSGRRRFTHKHVLELLDRQAHQANAKTEQMSNAHQELLDQASRIGKENPQLSAREVMEKAHESFMKDFLSVAARIEKKHPELSAAEVIKKARSQNPELWEKAQTAKS